MQKEVRQTLNFKANSKWHEKKKNEKVEKQIWKDYTPSSSMCGNFPLIRR